MKRKAIGLLVILSLIIGLFQGMTFAAEEDSMIAEKK